MDGLARSSRSPSAGQRRDASDTSSMGSGCGNRHLRGWAGLKVGALLVVVLFSAGCSAVPGEGGLDKAGGRIAPATVNLRMANTGGEAVDPFLERVAKASGGALTLTADPGLLRPTLTNEPDALRAVQAGRVDIAVVPTRSFDAVGVTAFDALIDPMLVDSLALQAKVLADPVSSDMLGALEPVGLVGIGMLMGPIRLPNGITRRLLGPSTYAGARVATNPSRISKLALRTLGAVPVESAFEGADMTDFDGLEQEAASVAANQYDGIVRWVTTNVGLWPRPSVIVAGADAWGRLTDTQRGWLIQAATGTRFETTYSLGLEYVRNMCRRGRIATASASDVEIDQLRLAFGPVERSLRSDVTTAGYLDRIQALKRQLGDVPLGQPVDCVALVKEPQPTPTSGAESASPAPTPVPAGPASTIDGNYALRTTSEELAAAGAAPGEVVPGNWGDLRWVFDHGRFSSTQSASTESAGKTCMWSYGTFRIHDGQVLELSFLGGGGGRNANEPGEVFDYSVSNYRDSLTLTPVAGAVSPISWTVKPWQRQATKSWTEFLDHDCLPPAGWGG